ARDVEPVESEVPPAEAAAAVVDEAGKLAGARIEVEAGALGIAVDHAPRGEVPLPVVMAVVVGVALADQALLDDRGTGPGAGGDRSEIGRRRRRRRETGQRGAQARAVGTHE